MGRHSSHSSNHSSRSSSHHGSGGGGDCPPPPIVEPPCRDPCRDRREEDLTRRFNREVRHSGHPTRYIVNDGSLVISESLLRDTNTLIYNRHGSRMRVLPDRCCCDGTPSCRCGCRGRRCCKGGGDRGGFSCCYCSTTTRITTTPRFTEYCRICVCRRASHGGYCRECMERRCIPPWYLRGPREPIRPLCDGDRPLLDGPSPRLLGYY